jgi:protein-tyrosine phosphatase
MADNQRPATNMLRILFVCTGNTCRSPMAEGLCRSLLSHFRLGQDVRVSSAGLSAMAGWPASEAAIAVMAEQGIDLSGHQAVCLTIEQVRGADLVLTMEERQKQFLLEKYPAATGKVFALKEYAMRVEDEVRQGGPKHSGRYDIPDPFGQPIEVYRRCAAALTSAITDICLDIRGRLKQRQPPV